MRYIYNALIQCKWKRWWYSGIMIKWLQKSWSDTNSYQHCVWYAISYTPHIILILLRYGTWWRVLAYLILNYHYDIMKYSWLLFSKINKSNSKKCNFLSEMCYDIWCNFNQYRLITVLIIKKTQFLHIFSNILRPSLLIFIIRP